MSTLVLRCGDVPAPITLAALTTIPTSAVPTATEFDENVYPHLIASAASRLVVLGDDAALAAILTRLLRTGRLELELGYVPAGKSPAGRIFGVGYGTAAARLAVDGTAQPTPLIRDDTGAALVGRAVITGVDGSPLTGEAYCDDTLVFDGTGNELRIEPTTALPGLAVPVPRRFARRPRLVTGRAVQLGTPGAVVTRDGVTAARAVTRASFYCHDEQWLLVR
ncbi:hypothetical protein [Skermania piniformis]|uniref:Peptidase M50 n=1 Tax=Skermania pinensis TaxID=39122 RepID=A0ABX8SAS2_9ACTN|nr:hypothetical protein [Skermania piniformis]QXQ13655.1 hypothetical protein KV203_17925 [Skermania piniformis]